jgi:hypothetical protein
MIIELTKTKRGFVASSEIDGVKVFFDAWGVGSKERAESLLLQYGEQTAILQKIVRPLCDGGFALYKTLPRDEKNLVRFAMICLGHNAFKQM